MNYQLPPVYHAMKAIEYTYTDVTRRTLKI